MAHLRPRRRLRRRGLPPGRHSQPRRSLLPGLAQRRPARLRSRSRSLARSRGGSATPRLAPLRVVTVPSCARARRCLAPAFAFANATLLPPRRVSSAHAPRRLAPGSVPGTAFPFVRYPGSGPSYALRRLGSHTPRISDAGGALSAQRCAGMRRTTPQHDKSR